MTLEVDVGDEILVVGPCDAPPPPRHRKDVACRIEYATDGSVEAPKAKAPQGTRLWHLDQLGRLSPLVVTRETDSRVYFMSPQDGSERFVRRAALQEGWMYCEPLRISIYTEQGRAAFERRGRAPDDALAALGLGPHATEADVKRAFRERAKRAHPDGGGDSAGFIRLEATYRAALAALAG